MELTPAGLARAGLATAGLARAGLAAAAAALLIAGLAIKGLAVLDRARPGPGTAGQAITGPRRSELPGMRYAAVRAAPGAGRAAAEGTQRVNRPQYKKVLRA